MLWVSTVTTCSNNENIDWGMICSTWGGGIVAAPGGGIVAAPGGGGIVV